MSETPKTGFLVTRPKFKRTTLGEYMICLIKAFVICPHESIVLVVKAATFQIPIVYLVSVIGKV